MTLKSGPQPIPLRERLGKHVQIDPGTGCWLWTGYIKPNGYASIWVNEAQKKLYAHRVAYELFNGPIPEGLTIDHLCRVRHCVNPQHLEPVTQGDNVRRGDTGPGRNLRKSHCVNGHALTSETTYIWKGHRRCNACHAERARRYRGEAR